MNAKTAETFLRLHRPDRSGAEDSRIAKALRFAERDAVLADAFSKQRALDHDAREAIRAIALPDAVRRRLAELHARPSTKKHDLRSLVKQPAFLAVVIALAVIAWLLVRTWRDRMANFPGRDAVEHMIDINESLTGTEFEPQTVTAGALGDWFMLKELDRFEVPPEFAAFKVIGSRVFKPEGHSVAQIAIQKDADNQMLFYIFRADDFGVKLDDDHWLTFTENEWAAGVRAFGPNVFMVVFKGDTGDMEKFLASVKARK